MELTAELLREEARAFSARESNHLEPSLYGVTDGKAVGTYLEAKFIAYLRSLSYEFEEGNAANGLDFPGLNIDIKVTSIKQPQSSCPYRGPRQKIYGLGYSLIVFVYSKADDAHSRTSTLSILHTVFIEADRTADYTMTKGLLDILDDEGNEEDLAAFMQTRSLSDEYSHLMLLAEEIIQNRPKLGYLTISPALQWRLQYKRVIDKAGTVEGVISVYKSA